MLKNFIIVGTQRTGSSALYQSLNRHPEIACGGEWITQIARQKKLKVTERALAGDFTALGPQQIKRITAVYDQHKRWLGFKLLFRSSDKWLVHPRFSPALWLDRLEDYRQWLSCRPAIHVIHIVRQNSIEWLKSKYLSSITGRYSKTYPDDIKVEIPLHQAIKRLRAKNWVDTRLATLAESNPYLRIYYEDFLNADHEALVSIVQFLQCDTGKLAQTRQGVKHRQSQGNALDYIANYQKLVTELERYDLLKAQIYNTPPVYRPEQSS